MSADRWDRMQALFTACLELSPDERVPYLNSAAVDAAVRREVLSLLEAHAMRGPVDDLADRLGATAVPAAPQRVGPYAVIQPLARGGMGSVYLAERADGQFRHRVALKLIRRDLETEDLRQRFLAERQIVARITHPNITRLLDGGITEDGMPYFVMEYVEGLPIDQYCDTNRLTLSQRLELFRTVCGAVQHAHRNLVIHRDLKPANILVGADGMVKLLDFGIAKVLDPEAFSETSGRTGTGVRLMTPEFASPEQLRGLPVTTASDTYQLGLLLFDLLTGVRPRLIEPAATSGAVTGPRREIGKPSTLVGATREPAPNVAAIAAARGTTPERLRRQLAGDLDNIALRALHEQPDQRYTSVEQLAEDVRRHLAGLPVIARPETLGYIATKFVRRHRAGVAASAAIGVLLAVFGVSTAVQAKRVTRERDRAQQVSNLLLDLFKSASPDLSDGDTITVVEVLDRGIERIRTSLREQPDLQGAMLGELSNVYWDLGRLNEAAALAKEALTLRLASSGPEDPETARSLTQLSAHLVDAGHADSALPYAERAVDLARRRLGRGSFLAGRALQAYGYALQTKGDRVRARPALEEAIWVYRAHSDSGRVHLAATLVNLGWIHENEGNLDSAEAKMRESVAIRRAIPGNPYLVNSLGALADILLKRGNATEAEPVVAEAMAISEKMYPPGHWRLGASASRYAKVLAAKGDLPGAERRYREALANRRSYGDRSLGVASALNDLALFLKDRRGDLPGAEPLFREAASIYAEKRGPNDTWTAIVLSNLAQTVYPQGRDAEAEAIFRRAIPALEAGFSPSDTRLGAHLAHYGIVIMKRGRLEESAAILRRAVEIERGAKPPVNQRVARAEAALGACLVERRQMAEAEPLLIGAHRALTETGNASDPFLRMAAAALVKLYTRSNRPADAARFRIASQR